MALPRSNNNQYLTRQQPSGAAWENKSKKRKPKLVHGLFVRRGATQGRSRDYIYYKNAGEETILLAQKVSSLLGYY